MKIVRNALMEEYYTAKNATNPSFYGKINALKNVLKDIIYLKIKNASNAQNYVQNAIQLQNAWSVVQKDIWIISNV